MKSKKINPSSLTKWGIMLIFLLLLVISFNFYKKYVRSTQIENELNTSGSETVIDEDRIPENVSLADERVREEADVSAWIGIVNDEFGYRIKYPPLLDFEDMEDEGGYESFIRFIEKPNHAHEKGIAVGVRDNSLANETLRIKSEVMGEGEARLIGEESFKFKGYDAVRLNFEPVEDTEFFEYLENREVVLVDNGTYIYSISTVPEQMQKVLSTFEFVVRL